jgi:hypothetical protein
MLTATRPTSASADFPGYCQVRSLTGFGLDYEQPIGAVAAKKLLPPDAELPKMGYEVVLHQIREFDSVHPLWGFTIATLTLQNISGQLVLASSSHTKDRWETVFGLLLKPAAKQ